MGKQDIVTFCIDNTIYEIIPDMIGKFYIKPFCHYHESIGEINFITRYNYISKTLDISEDGNIYYKMPNYKVKSSYKRNLPSWW